MGIQNLHKYLNGFDYFVGATIKNCHTWTNEPFSVPLDSSLQDREN